MTQSVVPQFLQDVASDFQSLPKQEQLMLLLEFSDGLPDLPPEFDGRDDLFERVIECQSPVFIHVEVTAENTVKVFAKAPAESPTTRGFASILVQGLSGESTETVLGLPSDYPDHLGITDTVSPLRLRGMSGMLARIKNQVTSLKHSVRKNN